jgi:hypothetical protein
MVFGIGFGVTNWFRLEHSHVVPLLVQTIINLKTPRTQSSLDSARAVQQPEFLHFRPPWQAFQYQGLLRPSSTSDAEGNLLERFISSNLHLR